MPKSEVARSKMFRDFSVIKDRYIKTNHLKYWSLTMRDMSLNYDIKESEMRFMLFAYDLEFFTIDYMAEAYFYNKHNLYQRLINPLRQKGYIYKHFDKLTPSDTREDHLFRDELKMNYRVRYALSQTARLMVSKFYRKIDGEEQINVPS
jgi:hypothetical protein